MMEKSRSTEHAREGDSRLEGLLWESDRRSLQSCRIEQSRSDRIGSVIPLLESCAVMAQNKGGTAEDESLSSFIVTKDDRDFFYANRSLRRVWQIPIQMTPGNDGDGGEFPLTAEEETLTPCGHVWN